jgi:hypothetical protein
MARYLAENPEAVACITRTYSSSICRLKTSRADCYKNGCQSFFQNPEGTWRPPASDQNAPVSHPAFQRLAAAVNASGMPCCKASRRTNAISRERRHAGGLGAASVAAGLYEIGRALYEKSGIRFDGLDERL